MTARAPNNLFRLLEVLAIRRGLVVGIIVFGTLLSVALAFVLPQWYRGEALLLPPKEQTIKAAGLAELAEVTSVAGGLNLPVLVTASDLYARMLRSHAICDLVIEQFGLKARYDARNLTGTYVELMDRCKFKVTDEGLVSISVDDHDPKTAADLANAFVDELTALDQKISSSRATQNRKFVEERLAKVKAQLDSSRGALEEFQQANRAVDFDEQTKLAISQATDLKVKLAQVDLEVQELERVVGDNNPDLIDKRNRRRILVRQLGELERGGQDSSYFSLPVANIPALKGRYELLYSNVRVNEGLYETLLGLLEQAKVQEGGQSTTLSVLDRARVPELRSRPRRSIIVLAGFGFSLLLALLLASGLEYLRRLEESSADDYHRAMRFIDAFLGWLPGVRKSR
jgi:tyrosine-protein kinase Etk/Wzc